MKTSELMGSKLDWAVATALHLNITGVTSVVYVNRKVFIPSVYWEQGGPIIESERIDVLGMVRGEAGPWTACLRKKDEAPPWRHITEGPTPLIAAMRCFVASRLGDTVDIPEELK
jgi:hypothetical protein